VSTKSLRDRRELQQLAADGRMVRLTGGTRMRQSPAPQRTAATGMSPSSSQTVRRACALVLTLAVLGCTSIDPVSKKSQPEGQAGASSTSEIMSGQAQLPDAAAATAVESTVCDEITAKLRHGRRP
jgi:hypothetical protein